MKLEVDLVAGHINLITETETEKILSKTNDFSKGVNRILDKCSKNDSVLKVQDEINKWLISASKAVQ